MAEENTTRLGGSQLRDYMKRLTVAKSDVLKEPVPEREVQAVPIKEETNNNTQLEEPKVGQDDHQKLINTVINDDCLVAMSKIASNSCDLILCDLPYG